MWQCKSSHSIALNCQFQEIDNDPDIDAAVELGDHENGSEVDLEEKPQNMVELEIGGEGSPFLLRLLHMKQSSIPSDIQANSKSLKLLRNMILLGFFIRWVMH